MKKVALVIAVLIIVGLIALSAYYFLGTKNKYGEAPTPKDLTGVIVPPVTYPLKGKTFVVPNTENILVTLDLVAPSAKRDYPMARYEVGDGVNRGTLVALDDFVTELSSGRRAVPIVVNQGGSGEFFYLAIFTDDGTNIQHIASLPLGDRIKVERIAIEGSKVTVTYFVHDRGQAMAELPTVETVAIFDIASLQVLQAGRIPQTESYTESKQFSGKYLWYETTYNDGRKVVPAKPDVFTLIFNANQIQLGTDCNSASAAFSATVGSSTTFSIEPLSSTKMFCESSQETEYFKMFESVATYAENSNGSIEFTLEDGSVMRFTPVTEVIEYESKAPYTIEDVVSVTTENVDPLQGAIDDEYTEYTITLKNGSAHKVEVYGMMERSSNEASFTETGFTGDVATLMKLGE